MLQNIVTPKRRQSIRRNWLNKRLQGKQMEWQGVTQAHVGTVQFVTYSPYGDDAFYAYVVAGDAKAPTAASYIRVGV